jgi:hypothetical protein
LASARLSTNAVIDSADGADLHEPL